MRGLARRYCQSRRGPEGLYYWIMGDILSGKQTREEIHADLERFIYEARRAHVSVVLWYSDRTGRPKKKTANLISRTLNRTRYFSKTLIRRLNSSTESQPDGRYGAKVSLD